MGWRLRHLFASTTSHLQPRKAGATSGRNQAREEAASAADGLARLKGLQAGQRAPHVTQGATRLVLECYADRHLCKSAEGGGRSSRRTILQ